MGQHKYNPNCQLAKEGKLPPKTQEAVQEATRQVAHGDDIREDWNWSPGVFLGDQFLQGDRRDGLEEKIQILAQAVDACLDAALAVAPVNYKQYLGYMKENITEILEES